MAVLIAAISCVTLSSGCAAQDPTTKGSSAGAAPTVGPHDPAAPEFSWPRENAIDGTKFVIHQPQVESWAGPWIVATTVPGVIYTIPVNSPLHYVTYVRIYGTSGDIVYVAPPDRSRPCAGKTRRSRSGTTSGRPSSA